MTFDESPCTGLIGKASFVTLAHCQMARPRPPDDDEPSWPGGPGCFRSGPPLSYLPAVIGPDHGGVMRYLAAVLVGVLIGVACTVAYYEWLDTESEDTVVAEPESRPDGDRTRPSEPTRK